MLCMSKVQPDRHQSRIHPSGMFGVGVMSNVALFYM